MSTPSAIPPARDPLATGLAPAARTSDKQQFSGLAWTSLILGIIGVVGSIVPIFNNVTAIAAGVGVILGLVALFGNKKLIAIIGVMLGIAAIVFTVLAQQAISREIDKTVDEITNSFNTLQP